MVEKKEYKQAIELLNSVFDCLLNDKLSNECVCKCLDELKIKEEKDLFEHFPYLKDAFQKDLKFFIQSDPAIVSEEEVIYAYPGFKAITCYRIAHELDKLGYHLYARIIAEYAHSYTGIDIHPSAEIAVPFFIDHGTGIVIGETTIIGRRVKMYQGVTLGAISVSNAPELKGEKRHPTVGDDVVIYANATILGDIKIGDDVIIGSNTYIREDIPSHTTVKNPKPELLFRSH